jgi:outer membrane protein assembly factor BamE (lipoprotein component of BamABCDE complex)
VVQSENKIKGGLAKQTSDLAKLCFVSGSVARTAAYLMTISMLILLSACSSVSSNSGKSSKLARIKTVPIGSDKAAILKEFGAPVRIEMIDKKLAYTYEKKEKRKTVSSVTLMFDDRNKVIAKAIH